MEREDVRKKENDKEIVLTIGLPCAGKTTYIAENKEYESYEKLSRDELVLMLGNTDSYNEAWNKVDQGEVDRQFNALFKRYVVERKNIVIDMTFLSKKSRNRILSIVPRGYKKTGIMFNTELETIYARNSAREGKHIPEEVIEGMMKRFSVPTHVEFDTIIWRF